MKIEMLVLRDAEVGHDEIQVGHSGGQQSYDVHAKGVTEIEVPSNGLFKVTEKEEDGEISTWYINAQDVLHFLERDNGIRERRPCC
ncbi:MAG: hypothetical protein OXG98_12355 [Gemmatimonadetes bacterium]|nr:hypothetical protein [Gemmatimonadota bacterium]